MVDHQRQIQRIHLFRRQREADQPPPVGGHEIDGLRRDFFGGHTKIALVFTIFVIHEDDHFPISNVFNRLFNCYQRHEWFAFLPILHVARIFIKTRF